MVKPDNHINYPTIEPEMEFSAYLKAGLVAAAETLIGGYEGERSSGSLVAIEQGSARDMVASGISVNFMNSKTKAMEISVIDD